MNGQQFIDTVILYFNDFLAQYGFTFVEGKYSGRLYDVQFESVKYSLSISYEPGDDYLLVVLFTLKEGKLSDFDDRTQTFRLGDLNAKFMPLISSDEINENNVYFSRYVATTPLEKQLLKSAKDLRLCMKKLVP